VHRIQYAGNSVLTGSVISIALIDYAQALTFSGQSVTVEIPSVQEDGAIERATFLIGPSSELVSESEDSSYPDPVDEPLVQEFAERVRLLNQSHVEAAAIAVPAPQEPDAAIDDLELPTFDESTDES
jgi:hypothetical protein